MSVPHSLHVNHCILQRARRRRGCLFGDRLRGFENRRLIDRFEQSVEQYIRLR